VELYLGTGYRCQKSVGCGFRVMPASGADRDLDEAVRARRAHESTCRFAAAGESLAPRPPRTIEERRDQIAVDRVALEDAPPPPTPLLGAGRFRCVCVVCGEPFLASGGRATYCPKPSCQEQRRSAA
jgi:hypothetical protein